MICGRAGEVIRWGVDGDGEEAAQGGGLVLGGWCTAQAGEMGYKQQPTRQQCTCRHPGRTLEGEKSLRALPSAAEQTVRRRRAAAAVAALRRAARLPALGVQLDRRTASCCCMAAGSAARARRARPVGERLARRLDRRAVPLEQSCSSCRAQCGLRETKWRAALAGWQQPAAAGSEALGECLVEPHYLQHLPSSRSWPIAEGAGRLAPRATPLSSSPLGPQLGSHNSIMLASIAPRCSNVLGCSTAVPPPQPQPLAPCRRRLPARRSPCGTAAAGGGGGEATPQQRDAASLDVSGTVVTPAYRSTPWAAKAAAAAEGAARAPCRLAFVSESGICRCLLAAAAFEVALQAHGLRGAVEVECRATRDYCLGDGPDASAALVAAELGWALPRDYAVRQFKEAEVGGRRRCCRHEAAGWVPVQGMQGPAAGARAAARSAASLRPRPAPPARPPVRPPALWLHPSPRRTLFLSTWCSWWTSSLRRMCCERWAGAAGTAARRRAGLRCAALRWAALRYAGLRWRWRRRAAGPPCRPARPGDTVFAPQRPHAMPIDAAPLPGGCV